MARGLLGSDIASDLVPYLTAGAAAARQAAAEWMRSLRDASVEPALRVAIAREKLDLVKQAQMAAIESLGGSLEEYLNPQRLLADATKAMKKGLPPAIDWLDLARLPELRWADGSPVDPVIIQWFIVSAVKSKTAEPSPLLRRHFARMVESDVEELAQWLLDRWITQDLAGIPPARTASEATSARFLAMAEGTLGSALPSKGLLAVVAAGGGAPIVAPSVAYIDMWRGNRTSQCKSLIQMLAWIDHPLAAQAVLSISTRFRTKTIQAEAALQTELLAERKQWTLDELGDRTIPTSGFDHDGRLVLSYGQRTFTAQLTDDLKVVLVNDQTGSSIKALPEPRVDEDDEVVRRAKADLATARKEIKQAASSQPSRLARAMCMQRAWTLEDFRRDILGHPVMRRVASRLVWTAETETETLTFRPLTDATLLDVEDQTVGLCDDAVIRVAHDLTVSPGDGQRWLAHLRDYEVSPLITQFGRPPVPEQLGDVIDDFNGHLIGTFKLKRMMTKLGWGAGGSAGGGVIDSIVRQFPGSDFEAILDIAGMPAYAEDWTTALRLLYFIRVGQRPVAGNAAPIASLPPVLVAEIYNDVASIAAAGTGFDPEWEVSGALGKR
ncbi:MAG: DUF4132 domain-containing protein [Acidimicrobiales bacterium]